MRDDYEELMVPWHRNQEPVSTELTGSSLAINTDSVAAARSVVETAYSLMLASLCAQLTGYIYAQDHSFFERLVVDVIFSLGYGGRRRDLARSIGRSGDGGIDGIIALDELGLDLVYLQAKRLKPGSVVPVSAVRDFIGSLEAKHASKGIFVTTGQFTPAALAVTQAVSKRVILINGVQLTEMMARHNIGVRPTETLQFKEVDLSYFSGLAGDTGRASNSSASIQPRK